MIYMYIYIYMLEGDSQSSDLCVSDAGVGYDSSPDNCAGGKHVWRYFPYPNPKPQNLTTQNPKPQNLNP